MFVDNFTAPSGRKDLIKTGELFFRLLREFVNSSERESLAKAEVPLLSIKKNIFPLGVGPLSLIQTRR